jgi:hypothetical protein
MMYNEDTYNTNNYNVGILVLALLESISSSDSQVKEDSLLKAELLTLVDQLQKFFGGQYLAETVNMTDTQIKTYMQQQLDTVSLSDARVATLIKVMLETISISDIRTFVQSRSLQDFIVLIDTLTKQITDKRLNMESVRLQDWLRIDNAPYSDPWN